MKIKQWLWHNKEGAIIGGVIGMIFCVVPFLSMPSAIIGNLLGIHPDKIIYYAIISGLFYAVIGAFIDSLWGKNR